MCISIFAYFRPLFHPPVGIEGVVDELGVKGNVRQGVAVLDPTHQVRSVGRESAGEWRA